MIARQASLAGNLFQVKRRVVALVNESPGAPEAFFNVRIVCFFSHIELGRHSFLPTFQLSRGILLRDDKKGKTGAQASSLATTATETVALQSAHSSRLRSGWRILSARVVPIPFGQLLVMPVVGQQTFESMCQHPEIMPLAELIELARTGQGFHLRQTRRSLAPGAAQTA